MPCTVNQKQTDKKAIKRHHSTGVPPSPHTALTGLSFYLCLDSIDLFTKVYPWRQVAEGGFVGVVSVAAEKLQALGAERLQHPEASGSAWCGPLHLPHAAVHLQELVSRVPVHRLFSAESYRLQTRRQKTNKCIYQVNSYCARHFWNCCDIYTVVKVVHGNHSDNHGNQSGTRPSVSLHELYLYTPCSLPHPQHTQTHHMHTHTLSKF